MRLSLFATYSCLLLACGCTSSHQQESAYFRSDHTNPDVALTGLNAAMAEAIRDYLGRSANLNEQLRKRKGTLFLDNVNPEVVNVIRKEMEDKAPRIETNCAYFHKFTDVRSGKWARIIQIGIVSGNLETPIFRIEDAYSYLGGQTCHVELSQVNGKWQVVKFRVVAVS